MQFILSGNCSTCFGWMYHPKHVEQFPDKINCVMLHLVGYILEYFTRLVLSKICNSIHFYCFVENI